MLQVPPTRFVLIDAGDAGDTAAYTAGLNKFGYKCAIGS